MVGRIIFDFARKAGGADLRWTRGRLRGGRFRVMDGSRLNTISFARFARFRDFGDPGDPGERDGGADLRWTRGRFLGGRFRVNRRVALEHDFIWRDLRDLRDFGDSGDPGERGEGDRFAMDARVSPRRTIRGGPTGCARTRFHLRDLRDLRDFAILATLAILARGTGGRICDGRAGVCEAGDFGRMDGSRLNTISFARFARFRATFARPRSLRGRNVRSEKAEQRGQIRSDLRCVAVATRRKFGRIWTADPLSQQDSFYRADS